MRGKPLTQCLIRGCGAKVTSGRSKGLCRNCHRAAVSLVHSRKLTTWEELEQLGLINENNGGKFVLAFHRAKARMKKFGIA